MLVRLGPAVCLAARLGQLAIMSVARSSGKRIPDPLGKNVLRFSFSGDTSRLCIVGLDRAGEKIPKSASSRAVPPRYRRLGLCNLPRAGPGGRVF